VSLDRRRALIYALLLVALAAGAPLAAGRPGWSGPTLHTLLEAIVTTAALFLGILALVRFYSKKNNVFLFLGTGFLATAVLDGYHAVVSAPPVTRRILDPGEGLDVTALDAWSWLASRTLLALFFCLNWIGWRRERALGPAGRVGESFVYLMTALLAVVTIFVLQGRPIGMPAEAAFASRPLQFVPAALFLLALLGYLVKAHWRDNAFDHWLVLSLVLGLGADALYMAFSERRFDASFDVAHALKLASYVSVGVGLLISVYSTFRQAEESTEQLRTAKEAAEAATRAKSDFLAQMSHELRTPLNSIIGFANILRKNKRQKLVGQELEFLERIRDSGLHLLNLINEVLDLSKVEAGKMEIDLEVVSLDSLVHETIDQFRGQIAERDVALEARVPPRLEPIVTDRRKLKQILFNLVANAVKFTPRGSVTIEVGVDALTGRPVRVDVVDTGIGIPAEKREAIFEAFQQADSGTARSYGGTGLGLTISRSLARLLGYRLAVESAEGRGSVFSLILAPEMDAGTELAPSGAGHPALETSS
jgi:signal transduction histidine kinase